MPQIYSVVCADVHTEEHVKADKKEAPLSSSSNSTDMTKLVYGFAANMVAVVLYGSNFVPVKRVDTGDGKSSNPLQVHLYLT